MNHNHRIYYAFLILLVFLLVFVVTSGEGTATNVTEGVIESPDTFANNPKKHYSEIKAMNNMLARYTDEAKEKNENVKRKQYEWNMMNHGIHGRHMKSEGARMNDNVLRLQQRQAFESERTDFF